ncbi:mechanosensitive ion channel/cyclic nucleotide-binding domain protein [Cyanobium sp. PCC 7001]|nr:mechanosensitive ion channel/cyclic nucleotide-binding domain protein [Cyanobium sp. PCC 7001]
MLPMAMSQLAATLALVAGLVVWRAWMVRRSRLAPVPLVLPLTALLVHLVASLTPVSLVGAVPARWLATLDLLFTGYALIRLGTWAGLQLPSGVPWWPQPPKILRDLAMLLLAAAYTVLVLRERAGVNLVGLLTTSAVLTAVVGLAAQETLKDLFAGISLQLDAPFNEGDWIEVNGSGGFVQTVTLMNTYLKTFDGSRLVVPNDTVAQATARCFTASDPVGNRFSIGLDYALPPGQACALLEQVMAQCPGVLQQPPPRAWVGAYADSAITYELLVWQRGAGELQRLEVRSTVLQHIWYALSREGQSIPYPVRELRPKRQAPPEDDPALIDAPSRARLLSGNALFRELGPEQLARLAPLTRCLRFGPGEAVVREGDPSAALFQVVRGRVEVLKASPQGGQTRLASLGPGEVFGEMGLCTGAERSATVRAEEDTVLLEVERDDLLPLVEAEPDFLSHLAHLVNRRRCELEKVTAEQAAARELGLLQRMQQLFGAVGMGRS